MIKNFVDCTVTFSDEEMKIIEDSFLEWGTESGYVTGSWIEGEQHIDSEKQGEYWDFARMNALEQLKSIIHKNLNTYLINAKPTHKTTKRA